MSDEKIKSFISGSETFSGFTFKGCYTMNNEIFIKLFAHYAKTGENYLDLYSDLIYLLWESNNKSSIDSDIMYDYTDLDAFQLYLSIARKLSLFSIDEVHDIKSYIRKKRIEYRDFLEKKRNEPRRKSCRFTALAEVKNYIYGKYGKICLCCGSAKNISLDHVIPVYKGGVDDVSNLQPLCKSCNSRKGIGITDYRHKKTIENNL